MGKGRPLDSGQANPDDRRFVKDNRFDELDIKAFHKNVKDERFSARLSPRFQHSRRTVDSLGRPVKIPPSVARRLDGPPPESDTGKMSGKKLAAAKGKKMEEDERDDDDDGDDEDEDEEEEDDSAQEEQSEDEEEGGEKEARKR
eukprot:RCo031578